MTVKLELATFTPHLGTVFEVTAQGYDEALTLVEASPSRHQAAGFDHGFSLLLRGRRTDLYINPGLVTLRHAVLGALELYMAPSGRRQDGSFEYQIGFN